MNCKKLNDTLRVISFEECPVKNILVAVDGSESSGRALDFALDLAEKYSAKVCILNVSESPVMGTVPQEPMTYTGENVAFFARDLHKLHEEIINKAVAHAQMVKPGLEITSKLRDGDPALEIVAEAKEGGFDAVVIGHRGVGRVKEFFGLGGISEKVAHLAPCVVVIVR